MILKHSHEILAVSTVDTFEFSKHPITFKFLSIQNWDISKTIFAPLLQYPLHLIATCKRFLKEEHNSTLWKAIKIQLTKNHG